MLTSVTNPTSKGSGMNAQLCQASCVESPWFGNRVVASTTAAIATFQKVWREQQHVTDRARSFEMMADINDRTLKDIGAPEWLIARSNERRNAHHIHLLELYKS